MSHYEVYYYNSIIFIVTLVCKKYKNDHTSVTELNVGSALELGNG